MRVLIVEDERLAAEQLERMIVQYDEDAEILGKLSSVEETISWFMHNKAPDLAFMDIQLLDGTTFDILDKIEVSCPVIFTTAYDHYALEAFQLQSIDYLLKPINYYKLTSAFKKLEDMQASLGQLGPSTNAAVAVAPIFKRTNQYKSRFLVKLGNRSYSVPIEKIAYCFSQDKISFLVSWEQKRYILNHTLDQLEELLDPHLFFRTNRQTIAHIESIQTVVPYFKGRLKVEIYPEPDFEVIVSSKKASAFKEWLDGQ